MSQASLPDDPVAVMRRFNRLITRRIGVLREDYLNTEFTFAEGRVLFEIGQRDRASAAWLSDELGLDPGFLSRLLARLEERGLIVRSPSASDGRKWDLALTEKGRQSLKLLDERSREQVSQLLASFSPETVRYLMQSIATIERILEPEGKASGALVLRPPESGDLGWVVERHGALYTHGYGWNDAFEGFVASIIGEFVANFDPSRERCWIAELGGQRAGSIFLVEGDDPDTAKLRLLLVEPFARGSGVGTRLVDQCVRFGRKCGYKRIVLWTQSMLLPARRIYERAGFRLLDQSPHERFGQSLIGETWELPLEPSNP